MAMFRTHTSHPVNGLAVLDLIERAAIIALYGILTFNILHGFRETGNSTSIILLASEGSVVLFVLIRRRTTEISLKPVDWFSAAIGTTLPLLVQPTGSPLPGIPGITIICSMIALTGFVIQIAAKLTLSRSFGMVAANRGIKVTGPYRIVRHPMYAGYFMTQVSFLLINPSFWNLSIYAVAFGFQLARILAEEQVLTRDATYRAFAANTRFRLFPGLF